MKTTAYLFICLLSLIVGSLHTNGQEIPIESEVLFSIQAGDAEKLEEIVEKGGDLRKLEINGKPIIFEAAVSPSAEIIRLLARENVSLNVVDDQGYSPVMAALKIGLIDNAVLLSKLGASLEGIAKDGMTVRVLAEQSGLNNFGPIYDAKLPPIMTKQEANNLLLLAAEAGDWKAARFALKNEADVFAIAPNGWTPLMLAALGGHNDIVRQLLNVMGTFPDDVVAPDVDGINVMHAILIGNAKRNKQAVASTLLDLKLKRPNLFADETGELKVLAERENYPKNVVNLFRSARIKPVDTEMPKTENPELSTLSNWKAVQQILKSKGLYSGEIDGKPGKGTKRALFAYYEPLFHDARNRCSSLLSNVNWEHRSGRNPPDGYNVIHVKYKSGRYYFGETKTKQGKTRTDGYRTIYDPVANSFFCEFKGADYSDDKRPELTCYDHLNEDRQYSNCNFKILSSRFSITVTGGNFWYSMEEFSSKNTTNLDAPIPAPQIAFPSLPEKYR